VTGRKRWVIALMVLAAGVAAIVLALGSPKGLDSAAKVGALLSDNWPIWCWLSGGRRLSFDN
jgi:hypothetical protein